MLSNYHYCYSPSTLTFSRRPSQSLLLHCSIAAITTTTTTTISSTSPSPPLQPHFMVDFLTTSCGFPLDRATKVTSKLFSHLESTEKPNYFFSFMRSHGFNDAEVKYIVCTAPQLLRSDVDKTLAPKFKSLQDLGFSKSDIVHLIRSDPTVLCRDFHRSVLPKIQLWESLLGSRDNLTSLIKTSRWKRLLRHSLKKRVIPNISLLRSTGISEERIGNVVSRYPSFIFKSPEEMGAAIEHIENKLAIPRQSGMFLWTLLSFVLAGESGFNAKLKLMKGFGWSEAEFISAFRKAPNIVGYTEKTLSKKMEFLMKEAGCEASEVANCPVLLKYSLQRRMIPRRSVIKFLNSTGLIHTENKMSTLMGIPNTEFMERYVIPYKDEHPELHEMYMASSDSGGSL